MCIFKSLEVIFFHSSSSSLPYHSPPPLSYITMSKNILTTSNGNPVENNQTSQTAGQWGPVLLQDFHLIDKLGKKEEEEKEN